MHHPWGAILPKNRTGINKTIKMIDIAYLLITLFFGLLMLQSLAAVRTAPTDDSFLVR